MDTNRKKRIYFDFLWITAGLIGLLFYFSYPFELISYNWSLYDLAIIFTIIILILGFSLLTIDLIFKLPPVRPNLGAGIVLLIFGTFNLIFFIIQPNFLIVNFVVGILMDELGGFFLILYILEKKDSN